MKTWLSVPLCLRLEITSSGSEFLFLLTWVLFYSVSQWLCRMSCSAAMLTHLLAVGGRMGKMGRMGMWCYSCCSASTGHLHPSRHLISIFSTSPRYDALLRRRASLFKATLELFFTQAAQKAPPDLLSSVFSTILLKRWWLILHLISMMLRMTRSRHLPAKYGNFIHQNTIKQTEVELLSWFLSFNHTTTR